MDISCPLGIYVHNVHTCTQYSFNADLALKVQHAEWRMHVINEAHFILRHGEKKWQYTITILATSGMGLDSWTWI